MERLRNGICFGLLIPLFFVPPFSVPPYFVPAVHPLHLTSSPSHPLIEKNQPYNALFRPGNGAGGAELH
eukprot:778713-Pelagomonas_calceolata.AAC.6